MYHRLPHGPCPKDAKKIVVKMAKDGLVQEVKTSRGSFAQRRSITRGAQFNPELFSGAELQTLEKSR